MNPILQALNQNNSLLSVMSALRSGNPEALYNQLINNNPQFRQFVEQNKGKSAEQIAQENGIDLNNVINRISAQMRLK